MPSATTKLTAADHIAIVSRSELFDHDYYCAQARAAFATIERAIEHYVEQGWRDCLDPGPRFSTSRYLDTNRDVRESGQNPLCHYLLWGRAEGRRAEPAARPAARPPVPRPAPPSAAEWEALARRRRATETAPGLDVIDVVVPVYKGADETLRCLFSVLAARVARPFCLLVVDDHSPEEAILDRLWWLEERGLIEVCRTERNLGFVRACNLGIARHRERDIVLLNADTEVFDGWLDRLHRAAYRHPRTGTVTPFSNNAEICSYPHFVKNNWLGLEVSDPELDALMASANADGEMDLPTGVGFCLYLRRDCLAEIGSLDAENFGEGYGEENDLCRRASSAGWRNILAADVFVRHYGGVSFGASKDSRVRQAIRTVERLHPGYLNEVQGFIQQDPIRVWRQSVDLARMRRYVLAAPRPAILFITHNRGGGTEQHVRDMIDALEAAGTPCLVARPNPENAWQICVGIPRLPDLPNPAIFDFAGEPGRFAELLASLRVAHVHFHHAAGLIDKALDYIRLAVAEARIGYDVTIHDYMPVCPRIHLVDHTGSYCREPDLPSCQACISRHGSDFGKPVVWEWRSRYERFFRDARRIYVPAQDVARRMRRYFPHLAFHLRPHALPPEFAARAAATVRRPSVRPADDGARRTVAVLGAIGPNKGSTVLLDCARYAEATDRPLDFAIIGYTDRDDEFSQCRNVTIHGPYENEDLLRIIAEIGPDLIFLPSTWPETFSYTLSAAFAAGVTPVAFDFGAMAERIRSARFGALIPPEDMITARAIVDALLAVPLDGGSPPSAVADGARYPDPLRTYYGLEASGPEAPVARAAVA